MTLAIVLATGCSASADAPESRDSENLQRSFSFLGDRASTLQDQKQKVSARRAAAAQAGAAPSFANPLPVARLAPADEEQVTTLSAHSHVAVALDVPKQQTVSRQSHDLQEPVYVHAATMPSLRPPERLTLESIPAVVSALDWQVPAPDPLALKIVSVTAPEAPIATGPIAVETQPEAEPVLAALDPRVDIEQIAPVSREIHMAQVAGEGTVLMAVRLGGEVIGQVQFQVSEIGIGVHIGQILDLFRDRMDGAQFATLRGSQAAQTFVSLERVRSAGVPLAYDPVYDELVLGG